jgi:hypothetical protein
MAPRCETCLSDTGNWWSDCVTCGEGYFRQYDTGTCLDHCPTGYTPNEETRECDQGESGHISVVTFHQVGDTYVAEGNGTYTLKEGENGEVAPVNTGDRGIYFESGGGSVEITDVTLSSSFSMSTWISMTSFEGEMLNMESETETTSGESQDMVFTCSDVEGRRRLQGSDTIGALGVDYNG